VAHYFLMSSHLCLDSPCRISYKNFACISPRACMYVMLLLSLLWTPSAAGEDRIMKVQILSTFCSQTLVICVFPLCETLCFTPMQYNRQNNTITCISHHREG
jgi:hypothetical protein